MRRIASGGSTVLRAVNQGFRWYVRLGETIARYSFIRARDSSFFPFDAPRSSTFIPFASLSSLLLFLVLPTSPLFFCLSFFCFFFFIFFFTDFPFFFRLVHRARTDVRSSLRPLFMRDRSRMHLGTFRHRIDVSCNYATTTRRLASAHLIPRTITPSIEPDGRRTATASERTSERAIRVTARIPMTY